MVCQECGGEVAGRRSDAKFCSAKCSSKAKSRRARQRDPEKHRAAVRASRLRYLDKRAAYMRAYRAKNAERVREIGRKAWLKRRDADLAQKRAHREANRDRINTEKRRSHAENRTYNNARHRDYSRRVAATAPGTGYRRWTPSEDAILMDSGLTLLEAALALGRGYSSAKERKARLRAKQSRVAAA